VIAGVIGIITGLSIVLLDIMVRIVLLGGLNGEPGFTGVTVLVYKVSPAFSFLLPFLGMVATGLILWRFASEPLTSGTDEVLEHYHFSNAPLRLKEGIVKYFASVFTIGFGGSAGLEGPSINSGAVVGSWLWQKTRTRLGLTPNDLRIMLLSGAAAGIAAIFKAPLTGIVFALEVPYKDDIARRAFLPSIISGVSSYVTLASFEGFQPLFTFNTAGTLTPVVLALSAILGLIIAGLSMLFSSMYHIFRNTLQGKNLKLMTRFTIGGIGLGFAALLAQLTLGSPYTYGPGYSLIQGSMLGQLSLQTLMAVFILRVITTILTLGTGGVGGIFFPLVLFGATIGSLFGILVQGPVSLYASVGIAAFMSAGYKTPLAAVTFIGDTTGSVSYLVPGMIASAIAYVVSGESSVSSEQKLWEDQPRPPPDLS
jgi:chloride channel protein, CIC family